MQSRLSTKPAETGAVSLLFSFNFLVEKVFEFNVLTDSLLSPGVSFRLLDFPTILLPLPVPPNKKGDVSPSHLQNLLSKDGTLKLNKGKSCLFEMTLDSLVRGLRESPVLVQLVDSLNGVHERSGARVPKVIGSALLNLLKTATALDNAVNESGKTSKCSVGNRKELCFVDTSGTKVAMLHVKYQLVSCGTAAGPHIEREKMSKDCSLQPHQDAHANQRLPCDHQEQEEFSKAKKLPYEVASVTDEVLNSDEISEMGTSSELVVADESERSYPNSSAISVIYLPNAVCPPPLFYQSDPNPRKPGCFIQSPNQYEVIDDNAHYVSDSAQGHWTVLMAHDQSSHPLAMKHNPSHTSRAVKSGGASNLVAPHDTNVTSLPLLSALLEELSILQSHISQPSVQTTNVPNTVEPEKASKCLQTDIQPTDAPVCKVHKNKRNVTPQHTIHQHLETDHSGKFFRECCMPIHPNALRVPKHKSVIYPPDITRVRRNFATRKATRVPPGMQKGTTKRTKKQAQPKQTLATKECSNESSIATLAQEESEKVNSIRETSAQTAMRKLEVFIPQAKYSIKSSGTSPLSVSLKSCNELPDEEQGAQTVGAYGDQLMDAGTQTELLVDTESVVDAPKDQDEGSSIIDTAQIWQGAVLPPKLSPQADGSQSTSRSIQSVTQSDGSMGAPQEGLNCAENVVNHAPHILVTKPLETSNVNTVVPHAGGSVGLSQEHPTPRASVDGLYISKKQSSLLNIASQTLDSFMSTDSLDVMDSAVLPKKHQAEGVLYLATSQSTMGELSQSDHRVDQGEHSNSKNDDSYSYSQEYPDDFEQFESDSGNSSSL